MSLRLYSGVDGTEVVARAAKGRSGNAIESKNSAEPADKVAAGEAGDEMASQAETLDYLMALTVQIRKMAQRAGFRRLGFILMLAEQEACQQIMGQDARTPSTKG